MNCLSRRSLASRTGLGFLILFAITSAAHAAPVQIPAGTELRVKLIDSLSTAVNTSGESFRAVLARDLHVAGRIVAAAGSPVRGRLVEVQRPRRLTRKAKISVKLIRLEIEESTYAISTSVTEFKARRDGSVVASTTMGAYAGGVAGATAGNIFSNDSEKIDKLAAIGAIAGAVFANKRKHIEFPPGHVLGFLLAEAISVEMQGGNVLIVQRPKQIWGVKFVNWRLLRYPFIVIHPRVSEYPFWAALILHGLLTGLILAFVWVRTRGSQAAPQPQALPKHFWIGFCLISMALILLLARLVATGESVWSWKWLSGGITSVVASLIAQWIYENLRFAVELKGRPEQPDSPQLDPRQPDPRQPVATEEGPPPLPSDARGPESPSGVPSQKLVPGPDPGAASRQDEPASTKNNRPSRSAARPSLRTRHGRPPACQEPRPGDRPLGSGPRPRPPSGKAH